MHVVKQNTVASLIAIETSFLANCLRDQRDGKLRKMIF